MYRLWKRIVKNELVDHILVRKINNSPPFVRMWTQSLNHYPTVEGLLDYEIVDQYYNDTYCDAGVYEDGITAMDIAAQFILDEGGRSASSSFFNPNVWYQDEPHQDFKAGYYENKSFHLRGFSVKEQREIYEQLQEQWIGKFHIHRSDEYAR